MADRDQPLGGRKPRRVDRGRSPWRHIRCASKPNMSSDRFTVQNEGFQQKS
jgi:hypothetical protein